MLKNLTHCDRVLYALLLGLGACGSEVSDSPAPGSEPAQHGNISPNLEHRAYVVSKLSDELTVIDLDSLEVVAKVPTGGAGNHMAELSGDFREVFVTSTATDEAITVDAEKLRVTGSIAITGHPSHITRTPDDRLFAVMAESTNEVVFLDVAERRETQRLSGFSTPHFMRFTPDGNYGYVANIGGNFLSRVDMRSMQVIDQIGLDDPADRLDAQEEGGFADAQIAQDGTLYAAHHASGKVLAIDAMTGKKRLELPVGKGPWVAFAEHPFTNVELRHVVPNFGDRTISVISGETPKPAVSATLPGDEEAYGVNYSPLEPDLAFVMNRVRQDVAVVDTRKGEIIERIDVGGNTETASTTPDGRYIVATVSNKNRVVVIDVPTRKVKKVFEGVGKYPWSITIPRGQNYCH